MSAEIKNQRVIEIIEENLHYFYSMASQNKNFNYKADNKLKYIYTSDYDWPNTIFFANFKESELEDNISEIKTKIKSNILPNSWTIGPSSKPSFLGRLIEQKGFTSHYHQTGMALLLSELKVNPNKLLVVRKVENKNDAKLWIECVSEGFEIHACDELINKFMVEEDISLYIGLYNDKVVTTLLLCCSENSAGLHAVTTLPEYRKNNFALTISGYALLEAIELGYKHAVLQASSMGIHVYKKLGFKPYCEFITYHLE